MTRCGKRSRGNGRGRESVEILSCTNASVSSVLYCIACAGKITPLQTSVAVHQLSDW